MQGSIVLNQRSNRCCEYFSIMRFAFAVWFVALQNLSSFNDCGGRNLGAFLFETIPQSQVVTDIGSWRSSTNPFSNSSCLISA
jgi:hypothetical protein